MDHGRDDAVADVLGTILMVGITVLMTVGLGILVFSMDGPPDRIHGDVTFEVAPGSGDWGDGDEAITLRHINGEGIPRAGTSLRILVDGAQTVISDSGLDGGFSDGQLRLGESYTHTTFIPLGAEVEALLVNAHGNQVIGSVKLAVTTPVTSGATTYVASHTAHTGMVDDFPAAQSASDGGGAAVLTEGSASATTAATLSADGTNTGRTAAAWNNPQHAWAQDGDAATLSTDGSGRALQLTLADPGISGDITQVVVKARVAIDGYANDRFQLGVCFGSSCGTSSASISGSASYQTISYDVTSARPGGGTWIDGDFAQLEARVLNVEQGSRDGTFKVDHVWVEVTHTTAAGGDLEIEFAWVGVPPAILHQLQIRYSTTIDTFEIQVWDGAWTTRGTLDASTPTVFSYTLQGNEYGDGVPRVRFVDQDPALSGTLRIDHARVVSA